MILQLILDACFLSANVRQSGDVVNCVSGRLYLTSCGGILGRGRVSALIPSRGSFKDYCPGGKEPINLCLSKWDTAELQGL